MGRRHFRGRPPASARTRRRAAYARNLKSPKRLIVPRLPRADRKALLLGTALASTMLLGTLMAPAPAEAAATCTRGGVPVVLPAPTAPIAVASNSGDLVCANGDTRIGTTPIGLTTSGGDYDIYLNNSGTLIAGYYGIRATTSADGSKITIINSGDITVSSGSNHYGILARTIADLSPIEITNAGTLTVTTSVDNAYGIFAGIAGADSRISITNSGDIAATSTNGFAFGIYAQTSNVADSPLDIWNNGNITAYAGPAGSDAIGIRTRAIGAGPIPNTIWNSGDIRATSAGQNAFGIFADTGPDGSPIDIVNSGNVWATSTIMDALGIDAVSASAGSRVDVTNSGGIWAMASDNATGIRARPFYSPIGIVNTGTIAATAGDNATGISAEVEEADSPVTVWNSGYISATATNGAATGIFARTEGNASSVGVTNSGDIHASTGGDAFGIFALTDDSISVTNSGDIHATAGNIATGISAETGGAGSPIGIVNSGAIYATGQNAAFGIYAQTQGANSPINIVNSGSIRATGPAIAEGIDAVSFSANSPITIHNSGSVFGGTAGIRASDYGNSTTMIVNSGDISASSNLAIAVRYGPVDIFNSGLISGFVLLDANDTFINQAGGVFEARGTSDFDRYANSPGTNDLFVNQSGAYGAYGGECQCGGDHALRQS